MSDLPRSRLTLYAVPVSLYCAKLRIVLRHKHLEWTELAPPGGYGSIEYRQIVVSGNLPALRDGSLLLADSEAIAEYLNDKYPDPPMWPADIAARAKARERGRFHDTRLEPALRRLFPLIGQPQPLRSTIDEQAAALQLRLAQLASLIDSSESTESTGVAKGAEGADPALASLAHEVKAGAQLTIGDCGLVVSFAWIDALQEHFSMPIVWPEAVTGYRKRIERHEAVAIELAEYSLRLKAFLAKSHPNP